MIASHCRQCAGIPPGMLTQSNRVIESAFIGIVSRDIPSVYMCGGYSAPAVASRAGRHLCHLEIHSPIGKCTPEENVTDMQRPAVTGAAWTGKLNGKSNTG